MERPVRCGDLLNGDYISVGRQTVRGDSRGVCTVCICHCPTVNRLRPICVVAKEKGIGLGLKGPRSCLVGVRLRQNECNVSPAGTAELSPGRSPGLEIRVRKVPKGRLAGTKDIEIFAIENSPGPGLGKFFSRPCGTFPERMANPELRPGLSSAVPTGLDFVMVACKARTYRPVTKPRREVCCGGRSPCPASARRHIQAQSWLQDSRARIAADP
jgi:hypothetical protein